MGDKGYRGVKKGIEKRTNEIEKKKEETSDRRIICKGKVFRAKRLAAQAYNLETALVVASFVNP